MKRRLSVLLGTVSIALTAVGCNQSNVGAIDSGLAPAVDSGPPDAGQQRDAGTVVHDAGTPDGGVAPIDAGPALSPESAACIADRHSEDCWLEWLKEVRPVTFTPVARGQLGAGPWPTTPTVELGRSVGITEGIVGASVDTGQNQYAVSENAFYVRRAGAASFERYARNTNGLRDYSMLSVAGGGPGIAYIGYEGVFTTNVDVTQDPPEIRTSGDVQEIHLQASGFTATTWDTHNSNTPLTGKFDHSRSIYELHVPWRGPAAGEVFLGTEHGVDRYQGTQVADHRHIATDVPNPDGTTSQRFGATKAMRVKDDGTVWYGNDWRFGGLPWTPRLAEWYVGSEWLFPMHAFGGQFDRNYNEGIDVDSKGNVWVGARTYGLAHLLIGPNKHFQLETFDVPDSNIEDVLADLDDTIWLATNGGLFRFTPATKAWTRFASVKSGVTKLFLDDAVVPRAIYIAAGQGVVVYRGP